ncbi:MAG: hypothetical protein QXR85_02770 [Candidatus Micrarchaeaceae archaeon]
MDKDRAPIIVFVLGLMLGIGLLWAATWASQHNGSDVWVVADCGWLSLIVGGIAGLYAWLKSNGKIR